jgi:hypothetical protein
MNTNVINCHKSNLPNSYLHDACGATGMQVDTQWVAVGENFSSFALKAQLGAGAL